MIKMSRIAGFRWNYSLALQIFAFRRVK